MARPDLRRFGRLPGRPGVVTERDWARSVVLEPRAAPRQPALIGDGSGLPFAPSVLTERGAPLDPTDPAVAALAAQLARSASKGAAGREQGATAPEPALAGLDGWSVLARAGGEVLFGYGRPPQLITVAARQDGRRGKWTCVAMSRGRPLRATRDGVRASGWRLDPSCELDSEPSVLRVLVTEQTWAGGTRADGRLLPPDLHVDAQELVVTMFVTPRPGFQIRSPNPETPARIALPDPVGARTLIDGALYPAAPVTESPP